MATHSPQPPTSIRIFAHMTFSSQTEIETTTLIDSLFERPAMCYSYTLRNNERYSRMLSFLFIVLDDANYLCICHDDYSLVRAGVRRRRTGSSTCA
jgi:hypothetical protein